MKTSTIALLPATAAAVTAISALQPFNPTALCAPAPAAAPNILFIAIDDLRDWANYLGYKQARTPNMDRLAAMGVAFANNYCAAPVCNASRTALLTGLRPSTTGVYENGHDWRVNKTAQSVPTLPVWFRQHGYLANASGKLYHEAYRKASEWDDYQPMQRTAQLPSPAKNNGVAGIRFRPLIGEDKDFLDYKTVDYCIAQLRKKHDKPLLLGCGFHFPHMPWDVPQKYFDMFPLDKIELPKVQPSLDGLPETGRRWARKSGDHANILKSGRWKEAVQAYLACITFMDTQLGRLLDAFEKSAHKDNTIIVLWSDHGWHLGEKEHWRKFALWEESTRSPMIWVVPGLTKPGGFCKRTVDYMDLYPTLCDVAGLPLPKHLEGKSYRSLLANPDAAWDRPAVTTYWQDNHSVRTEKWRYIRYRDGGEELYNHDTDPLEWKNLAKDPKYASVKEELKKWLPKINVAAQKGQISPDDNDNPDGQSQNDRKAAKRAKRNKAAKG